MYVIRINETQYFKEFSEDKKESIITTTNKNKAQRFSSAKGASIISVNLNKWYNLNTKTKKLEN